MPELDPSLKCLIEANSAALGALLSKIASGETDLSVEISQVSATDADLKSAVAGVPAVDASEPPPAA